MAANFFDLVMKTERAGLAAEQRLSGSPPATAVCDIAEIRDHPMMLRAKHPVVLESLGDLSFVQVCPSLGYRFLWTHVERPVPRALCATSGPVPRRGGPAAASGAAR